MKLNQMIGAYLLILTAATIVGMVLGNQGYWNIYNYATIILSVPGAMALFRQK